MTMALWWMRLIALVVGCSVLVGCQPAAPASKATPLDIHVGLILSNAASPVLVPMEQGAFAARGLNVSVQSVTDTAQAMTSVVGGQLEMGVVTMGSAALNAFNRGTDLKIIAAGAGDPPGHGANAPVVVRSQLMDSGAVTTVADLKGKKVAINGRGVLIEYLLARALAIGDLKPTDVEVVVLPFPEMVVALGTGALDAGMILQPLASQAIAKGVGKMLTDDYNPDSQNTVVLANSKFLDQHRDAVVSFLEVYLRSIRRLSNGQLKQDEQALAVLQKHTNTPPEVIRLAPDPYWPPDGRPKLDSLEDQQQFFMRTGSLDYAQPVDFRKLIDYGPLESALKNLGN
jgi:NitT/TauT family transport system substrate-binding protein